MEWNTQQLSPDGDRLGVFDVDSFVPYSRLANVPAGWITARVGLFRETLFDARIARPAQHHPRARVQPARGAGSTDATGTA